MDVSCITTQQMLYWTVDVPSSVCRSGIKSFLCLLALEYASRLKIRPLGRGACKYAYPAGTLSIWEPWPPSFSQCGAGGVRGGIGISSGVGCLGRSGRGAPIPLYLQHVWGFFVVPFWQGRQLSVWFSQTIAVLQPSPFYALETQLPIHSLHRLQLKVSWKGIVFPLLSPAKTLPWPFWPYSRFGACGIVLAIPDLLALP